MQLLHCSPLATPEFASLSLLHKGDNGDNASLIAGESMAVASPLSTASPMTISATVIELHRYLNSLYNNSNKENAELNTEMSPETTEFDLQRRLANGSMAKRALRDDRATIWDSASVQVFRPSHGHGIGLHYLVVTEPRIMRRFASVLLPSSSVAPSAKQKKAQRKNSMNSAVSSTSQRSGESASAITEAAAAVVLCVGVSGLSFAAASSPLVQTLPQRLHDCVGIISKLGLGSNPVDEERRRCARSVLSTLLLTDEEERKTNEHAEAEVGMSPADLLEYLAAAAAGAPKQSTPFSKFQFASDLRGKRMGTFGKSSSRLGKLDDGQPSGFASSSEVTGNKSAAEARVATERMAILSIAEHDMPLRLYEERQRRQVGITGEPQARSGSRWTKPSMFSSVKSPSNKQPKSSRRTRASAKAAVNADLSGFDYVPSSSDSSTIQSISEGFGRVSMDEEGTVSADTITSKTSFVPTLMAPKKDVTHSNRRNTSGTKGWKSSGGSVSSSNKSVDPSVNAAWDSEALSSSFSSLDGGESATPSGAEQMRQKKLDLVQRRKSQGQDKSFVRTFSNVILQEDGASDPNQKQIIASPPPRERRQRTPQGRSNTPNAASGLGRDPSSNSNKQGSNSSERNASTVSSITSGPGIGWGSTQNASSATLVDEGSYGGNSAKYAARPDGSTNADNQIMFSRSESELQRNNHGHPPRLVVNVALNEDLTCSYENLKIASCVIEGVVQVQMKSNVQDVVPFQLILKDPSNHIKVLHENVKYVEDNSLESTANDASRTHNFTITIPKSESYYPIMKYRCSSDLRPVPIRVQTRVRLHGAYCRVALQISSNPANDDDLRDLTIIMTAPKGVKGESLTTSPTGGVWQEKNRSVLWCVAELGEGEKFQLQAQFELEDALRNQPENKRETPRNLAFVAVFSTESNLVENQLFVRKLTWALPKFPLTSSNQSLGVGELLVDSSGAPTKSGEGVEKLGKQGLFVKKVGLFIASTCNGNGVEMMLSEKKL
eukprot:scaffold145888_cov43-Attheya_sp.AAC.3